MSAQRTPGQWEINGAGWDVYIVSANDPDTTICKVDVLSDDAGDTSVTIANARLIAQAPDLLADLQEIVAGWELIEKGGIRFRSLTAWEAERLNMARAAIARATGQAVKR